jgi:hypothetical protein
VAAAKKIPPRRLLALAAIFLAAGLVAASISKSYITTPWRIRQCTAQAPRPDVVIIGNSRTQESLSTKAVEDYFARKGLRYFIMASEGSGFRLTQLILERLDVKPRILLVANESFTIDILEDSNRQVVMDPDRFYTVLSAFYHSKQLQNRICASDFAMLRELYCRGRIGGAWRRIDNGALVLNPSKKIHNMVRVVDVPETRLHYFDLFMGNARIFLASPSVKGGCIIDYVVPSLNSSVDLARKMAAAIDAPLVFPPLASVGEIYSYDGGSHLTPESSERWSAAFVKDLDPEIDKCVRRTAPGRT